MLGQDPPQTGAFEVINPLIVKRPPAAKRGGGGTHIYSIQFDLAQPGMGEEPPGKEDPQAAPFGVWTTFLVRSSRSLSRSACSYDTCVRLLTSATCSLIFARKSPARSLPKVRPEAYMPIRMLMAAGGAGGETARAPPTQRDDDVFRTKIEAREKRNNLSAGLKRS